MKKLLFPTDFSLTSLNSMPYALEIANRTKAAIYLLNVYSVTIYDPNMPAELLMSATEQAEKTSKESLEKVAKDFEKAMSENGIEGVAIEIQSKQGLVVDEIINYVSENDIDLVIMGTTGASGMMEKIFGSNASSVIEKTPTPVLAIPDEAKYKGISNIVYATDLQESETNEINSVAEFAGIFDAEMTLLHVCDKSEEALIENKNELYEDLRKNINYPKVNFELIKNEDVVEGIDSYVKANKVDVIGMASHKRSLLGRIFSKSLTKSMVYHCHIPLLALERDD